MEITEIVDETERIAALENRVRNMDALVRGLVTEVLDLKTVIMRMPRQDVERQGQEPGRETVVPSVSSGGSIIIRPKVSDQQDLPATPAEPAMVRIMQPDGTMKLEPRYGNKKTI